MEKIYSYCYDKREDMLSDIRSEATFFNKLKFSIINFLANKY